MQKIISALVILASMSVGVLDALASGDALPRGTRSASSDVAPDPLPLDLSDAPSLRMPERATAPASVPSVEIVTWGQVMICGEFEPLANDRFQQVRRCEVLSEKE